MLLGSALTAAVPYGHPVPRTEAPTTLRLRGAAASGRTAASAGDREERISVRRILKSVENALAVSHRGGDSSSRPRSFLILKSQRVSVWSVESVLKDLKDSSFLNR